MGIDHINEKAWKMSQNGFHETMLSVERIMAGEPIDERKNIEKMMEGLLLSGLAMQVVKSDLPSSGAEHQLTGIWEMERAVSGKDKLPHGKLLSIALLSIAAVYNKLLAFPLDEELDVKRCVKEWPSLETYERKAHEALSKVGLQKLGMQVAMSNYVTPEQLSIELQQLKEYWPEVRDRLAQQIMPVRQLYDILKLGRMPVRPIDAGISWEHVRQTLECVPYLSKRFNVMSLVARTGYLTPWLDDLFIKTKKFETL
jgi:glycerol-1-phosphate dehydrogenase [NAD(P)+]